MALICEAVGLGQDGNYSLDLRPVTAMLVNAVNELDAKVRNTRRNSPRRRRAIPRWLPRRKALLLRSRI
jgi:hypothetical protein